MNADRRAEWLFGLKCFGAALAVAVFLGNALVLLVGQWRHQPDQLWGLVGLFFMFFTTGLPALFLVPLFDATSRKAAIFQAAGWRQKTRLLIVLLVLFVVGLVIHYEGFGLRRPQIPDGYGITLSLIAAAGAFLSLALWFFGRLFWGRQFWPVGQTHAVAQLDDPLIIASVALLLATPLLSTGWFVTGDFNAHVARIHHVMQGGGDWRFDWFLGGPALGATGPLPFWLGGALGLFGGGPDAGARLLLLLAHLVGALALCGLLRQLGLRPVAVLAAVLVYAGAAARWEVVMVRGQVPQALLLALMPLLGWVALRALNHRRFWILLPLLGAMVMLTHPLAGAVALVVVAVPMVWLARTVPLSSVLIVVGLVALGAGAAAGWLWQMQAQWSPWLVATPAPWPNLRLPPMATLWVLPGWRGALAGAETLGALGLPACALMIWALWRRVPLAWVVLSVLVLVLVVRVPFARLGVPVLFLASLLVALGMAQLRRPGPWLAILALWMASTSLYPLARPDIAALMPKVQQLAAGHRVIELHAENGRLSVPQTPGGGLAARFQGMGIIGPHNAAATPAHNPLIGLLARIETDWQDDQRFEPENIIALTALDVGALFYLNRGGTPCLAPLRPVQGGQLCALRLTTPSPVSASTYPGPFAPDQAAPMPRDQFGLMAWQGEADFGDMLDPAAGPSPRLLSSQMGQDFWELTLDLPQAMPLRVATSCAARVPGYRVGCDRAGLLVIDLPAGRHDLRLLPPKVGP